ncbi:LacI family DNA-binding transcriptional regulator [Tenggerimyces flavus]|uniref:LacI family DNA-binding transcriptional regulator n=1 Tax=Tenggerimyces flavus TaxID=1708749 RepID=A0ABV7Y808_9ACTN|nr:LacI family DNA-binding transcriptional regulator [Tenggerimyces flavus]MBM7785335.1 LacI family transcriptional regulator [Tenggerimyces flavus]
MSAPEVVTLGDVARRAGVSLATASRVLNGSTRRVNEELRTLVHDAASALGYTPNLHAQAVARGTSSTVGLIVHDIGDPYFSAIASGVMRVADDRGLIVTLGTTSRNPNREVQYVAMMRAQRARAVILAGSRVADREQTERLSAEVTAFRRGGGRVAAVSQQKLPTDTVLPENRAGARELATRLAELGHRRFGVLAGPRTILTARDRLSGFRAGLSDAGLPLDPEAVIEGPFTRDGGYQAARELLERKLGVTCVFAVNDVMAVGAMAACRELGVSVPGDLSMAGFDDIETLRDLVPPLTTVRLPLEEMGMRAAELALDLEPPDRDRLIRIRGEVVLRESTRKIRSRG